MQADAAADFMQRSCGKHRPIGRAKPLPRLRKIRARGSCRSASFRRPRATLGMSTGQFYEAHLCGNRRAFQRRNTEILVIHSKGKNMNNRRPIVPPPAQAQRPNGVPGRPGVLPAAILRPQPIVQAKRAPVAPNRIIQRAAEAQGSGSGWPTQITVGGNIVLTLKAFDDKLLYENNVKSASAGNFHVTIHMPSIYSHQQWDPAKYPLSGRYYSSKRTHFSATIRNGVAAASSQYSPAETDQMRIALNLTQDAYNALKPVPQQYQFSTDPGAHMFRTTMHKGSIPF